MTVRQTLHALRRNGLETVTARFGSGRCPRSSPAQSTDASETQGNHNRLLYHDGVGSLGAIP